MAYESSTSVGSGTLPFTTQILSTEQRGQNDEACGERRGTNVVVINPEDVVAVDAVATSGVVVSTTAVELIAPNINPLPRSREVVLENTGGQALLIGHFADFADAEAFELATSAPNNRITLPLLHNVSLFGRTATGTTTVKFIVY
jgi:hypothetical protein